MGTLVLAGRYEIVEKIGDGGMAVVYKARDKQLNRFVAIKILKKEFISDQTFVENFIKEAKAAASLQHPNIVTIYDAGKDRDIYYIVMEYVEGRALSELIAAEAPLDYKRCIRIAKQIASALALAHSTNIIHRDVKPHNILMMEDGTAKITDFGIAKAVSDGTIINDSGIIMGSVHYFSPEQSRGQYVDEKSDIYSLGIVLYEMITGRVPFDADNPVTIAVMHMNETIIPPSKLVKGVPPGLEQIVMKATAKFQSDRFSNIDEMYKALDNVSFVTGLIEDPVIAGYVKPTNMVEENPGQGYNASAPPEEPDYEPDYDYEDPDDPDYDDYDVSDDRTGDDIFKRYDLEDEDGERSKKGMLFGAGAAAAGAKGDEKDLKDSKGRNKLTKQQKIILIVAAIAVAVALSFPLSKVLVGLFAPAEPVEVPDVVGMYVEEATDILKEEGFLVNITIVPLPPVQKTDAPAATEDMTELPIDSLYDPEPDYDSYEPEYREGQVMAQDPEGGTMVKAGTKVELTVAGAPEEIEEDPDAPGEPTEVPDLIGKTKANAEYAIKTAGFTIGLVGYENSELPIDTVIDQSPQAGEMAPGNSRIAIVISLGPREELIQVPNLIGMTEPQVQQALQDAGLRYTRGENVDAKNLNEIDKAVAQRPAANASVSIGESVTVDFGIGFTVTFRNGVNDSVIAVVSAIRGGSVTYPSPPTVSGHTFANWSPASLNNIQRDEIVTANYTANPPPAPTTYTLTVNQGTGGGAGLQAGTTRNISANNQPDDGSPPADTATHTFEWKFIGWSSSGGGTFANPASQSTTFTMPASNVTVTPTFGWVQVALPEP